MNVHLPGALRRRTSDYDIYTPNPRATAHRVQARLDREVAGQDDFFAMRAKHKGTWKVKHEGPDQKKHTKDDIHIVDYTRTPRGLRTVKKGGYRYESLASLEAGRRKNIRMKSKQFRWGKDRADLARIEGAKILRNMMNPKWWERRR